MPAGASVGERRGDGGAWGYRRLALAPLHHKGRWCFDRRCSDRWQSFGYRTRTMRRWVLTGWEGNWLAVVLHRLDHLTLGYALGSDGVHVSDLCDLAIVASDTLSMRNCEDRQNLVQCRRDFVFHGMIRRDGKTQERCSRDVIFRNGLTVRSPVGDGEDNNRPIHRSASDLKHGSIEDAPVGEREACRLHSVT